MVEKSHIAFEQNRVTTLLNVPQGIIPANGWTRSEIARLLDKRKLSAYDIAMLENPTGKGN